jgi:cysteinyl-tRNA synthetase
MIILVILIFIAGFSSNEGNFEDKVKPILDTFTNFRAEIRQQAIKKLDYNQILKTCDKVRDDELILAGVKLEDKGSTSIWKIEDVNVLLKEKQFKLEEQERIFKKNEEIKKQREEQLKKKEEEDKINPKDMFKTSEFSKWDDNGIPTHMADGSKISDSKLKNLKKKYETQTRNYSKYLEKNKN